MNYGKVYLFDEIVGDEISSNLVITCRIVDLLFGQGVAIESFHAYFKQVFFIQRFHKTCHFLNPTLSFEFNTQFISWLYVIEIFD